MPLIVYVKHLASHRYAFINNYGARLMGREVEDVIGCTDEELFPPEVVRLWRRREERAVADGQPLTTEDEFPQDDGMHIYHGTMVPLRDDDGYIHAIAGISSDITELKLSEKKRLQLQQEVIEAQMRTLRELANPIIPLSDRVITLPLIGRMDHQRGSQVLETLLEGVTAHQARTVIIDVTGVPAIDGQAADTLTRATQAVQLLGAEVILTGLQPETAQALAKHQLGLDLSTYGTLRQGIEHALRRTTPVP
jgi:anti-anti-sigma regulatory factor